MNNNSIQRFQSTKDSDGSCTDCTAGYFCPTIGAAEADREICNQGYYCEIGATYGSPDNECGSYNGDPCGAGEGKLYM